MLKYSNAVTQICLAIMATRLAGLETSEIVAGIYAVLAAAFLLTGILDAGVTYLRARA